MGKHRRPSPIRRTAAVVVPAVAISAVLLTSGTTHTTLTADVLKQAPRVSVAATSTYAVTPEGIKPLRPDSAIGVPGRSSPVASPKPALTFGQRVIKEARKYFGVPYVWGGTSPAGFDCSGLTSYVYEHAGRYIPRTADEQYRYLHKVPKSQAKPGDLVFFHDSSGYVYHVGIYVGGTSMIAAPHSGTVVQIESFAWAGSSATFGHLTGT